MGGSWANPVPLGRHLNVETPPKPFDSVVWSDSVMSDGRPEPEVVKMKTVWIEDEAHEEGGYDVPLPTAMEVCPTCRGRGRHVNRAIDGNGITADEWWNEWDDESREMYLTGGYDVVCEECDGQNVVEVVDEDACSPELLAAWQDEEMAMAEMRATERMERMMGC